MLNNLMITITLLTVSSLVQAKVDILACEPEWASLAREIGGDKVEAYAATTAFQDPHHIQARPSLLAKARKADLLICSGAELEAGWLPILLKKSGNGASMIARIIRLKRPQFRSLRAPRPAVR